MIRCVALGDNISDEEIGGKMGMETFVDHEEFRKLNHGFSLDEGVASEDDIYRVFYAERRSWCKPVFLRVNYSGLSPEIC